MIWMMTTTETVTASMTARSLLRLTIALLNGDGDDSNPCFSLLFHLFFRVDDFNLVIVV